MSRWKGFVLAVALSCALTACGNRSGQRSTFPDRPAFGGSETEIVFSYRTKLIPPVGVPDWQNLKVASLPSIQLEELGPTGTLSLEQRNLVAGKQSPEYIELLTSEASRFSMRRLKPGRYAFVKVIDAAQSGGQGLICFDHNSRPLDEAAVITLTPGASIYAGHLDIEIALTRSADPKVLEASFVRLVPLPSAPDEDFRAMRIPESGLIRQPGALAYCQPWVFRELAGRRSQCTGATRAQLDDRVKIMRQTRSIMQQVSKQWKTQSLTGPEQILYCPG